ncbi:MAG: hypothetical protein ACE5NM_01555 [Sedimentisphaerales bacterium]
MTRTEVTIYCHCAYSQIIPNRVKLAVLDAIKNADIDFVAVADLCEASAKRDGALKQWTKAESIKIVACYPRAVKWLFYAAGAPLLHPRRIEFLNMRVDSTEKIISSLQTELTAKKKPHVRVPARQGSAAVQLDGSMEKTGDWIPWFPVIDYDRCKNCKQCFNFCLFGVYELSQEGKVEVKNPANCKTNCPACARMCPQSAIMFPKYSDGPINGDEVDERTSQDRKADLSQLLSGNIYDAIRQHSKKGKRFSKGPQLQNMAAGSPKDTESPVLRKLQEKLDIPSEVLASLSPGQLAQIEKKSDKKDLPNTQRGQNERNSKKEQHSHE